MIIFFTIPIWFILAIFLFCVVGAGMFFGKIIMFLSEYLVLIALLLIVMFCYSLSRIKDEHNRVQMIACGIGMAPLFVYMGLTLPILAEIAIDGSIFRLVFYLIGYVFEVALYAFLGLWIPVAAIDKKGWEGEYKTVWITLIWCFVVICHYVFVRY